eukprot:gene11766-8955_t
MSPRARPSPIAHSMRTSNPYKAPRAAGGVGSLFKSSNTHLTNSVQVHLGLFRCPQTAVRTAQAPHSAAPSVAEPHTTPSDRDSKPAKTEGVAIIGAGPAGLATAIMLARRGYTNIKVYERMSKPPASTDMTVYGDFEQTNNRLYMIGLNGRGQKVLRSLGVMDRIREASSLVGGRMDWKPETPPDQGMEILYNRTYTTHCIQRDRLSACLLEEVREKYGEAVNVEFGVDCRDAEWKKEPVSGSKQGCNLSLCADGTGSSIRNSMEADMKKGKFRVKRFEDTNALVYRTIPLHWTQLDTTTLPQSKWRRDLNYSIRTGKGVSIDCLPTREGPHIGVVLYKPGEECMVNLKTGR